MKIKGLLFIGCCMVLLLASCQSTTDLPSSDAKGAEQIARLINGKASGHSGILDESGGVMSGQEDIGAPTATPSPGIPSTSTPSVAGAPASTSMAAVSSPTVTIGSCTVSAPMVRTIYSGPGTGYTILGQIEPDHKYLVTGMYYTTNYPTWWRIDYSGTEGWIDGEGNYTNFMPGASCNPPVEIIEINPPPAGTPWPTPQIQPGVCYVAPVDEMSNLLVYGGPAHSYPVLGATQPGQYYLATGQLPLDLPDRFIQIDYNGMPGWVDASRYMFNGGCWPIPTLPVWPTPIVTSPPRPTPSINPTSTLSPEVNLDQVTYISGAIGATTQITRVLPTANDRTTAVEAIRINFGPSEVGSYDGVRMLNVLVQCTGVNPQNLRWGYYGSEANIECGRYIDTGVSQGGNLLILGLAVPADGMTSVYYTITVTVNAP